MSRKAGVMIALALLAAAAGWLVLTDIRLKRGFERITAGEQKANVVTSIGEPHDVVPCSTFRSNPMPACVEEYTYLSLLSFTDVWTVDFDVQGYVVGKYRYRSP
jgi:hypothetical protein